MPSLIEAASAAEAAAKNRAIATGDGEGVRVGDTLLDGSGDGEVDCDDEAEPLTLALLVALADTLPLPLAEADPLPEALAEPLTLLLALAEIDTEGETDAVADVEAATLLLALAELPGLTLVEGEGADDGSSEADEEAERLADCVSDGEADREADAVLLMLWLPLSEADTLQQTDSEDKSNNTHASPSEHKRKQSKS